MTRGPELLGSDGAHKDILPYHWSWITLLLAFFFFSLQPFNQQLLLLFHLLSWWYSPVLVRVAGEQSPRESMTLNSISFWQIFSPSRPYHHAFVWTQSNTQGWKRCAGQTDLHATEDLDMRWCLHYYGNALCLTNKNHYAEQKSETFEQECCSNVQYVSHLKSSDNSVVMAATRLDGLLNNSGGNQFDGTQTIHAEISLCMPSSAACHFLDTCN